MESGNEGKTSKWLQKRWEWICKNWWYLVLLSVSTIYVFIYRFEIYTLAGINAVAVGAILWVILLLLPLFSEFEFLGIKLKKELEKVSNDVKTSVDEVKNQIIQMRFNNSQSIDINLLQSPLPDKQETRRLESEVEQLQTSNRKAPSSAEENEVPKETIFLFKVRLRLEKILLDLCEKTDYKGSRNVPNMLQHILRCQLISYDIYNLTLQLIKIANRGVHGEIVDNEYLSFSEKTYPVIISKLEEAQSNLHYLRCRKCGFAGYTTQDGVCPKCGEYEFE